MAFEDFFTLVEMKNGITTLARVEELINTMQQQKNCPINNISDATRQWAKVISTITATENEDCLKLFVKLKGLTYFNQWVLDVLKFSNENTESIVEDFLSVLLGSLEKLPVVEEDSAASEMQLISEKLVRLENPNIKERARTLFERWTQAMEIDAGCQSLSNNDNGKDANSDAVDCGKPIASDTDNLNDSQLDKTTDLLTETFKDDTAANAIAQNMDALPSAIVPNSSKENLSVTPGYVNEELEVASFCKDGCREDVKMTVDSEQAIPSKPDQTISKVQSPSKLSVTPAAHIPEQSESCNFGVNENNSHALKSVISPPRSASMDCIVPKHSRNIDVEPDMQCLLPNGSKLKSDDGSKETPSENMEEVESGSASEVEVGSLEPSEKKSTPRVDHNSDFGLEYGEIDALEVARQVAIEVEREVVDYREPFCNSSPDRSSREDGVDPMLSEPLKVEESDKREADVEQSIKQMTEEATSESGTNKNKCVFDLNEDICIEESESMVNLNLNNAVSASLSTPVPVTASKDSPALPVGPLKFEGELGWKGSAATSAFRSSPKTPDIEKTSSSQKRKAKCIEFDLNVVGQECDPDDSVEVSSKKPEKMKLDLNQLGYEETSQPQVQSNSYWNPAASSSSKQPQARGFDLNNNPIFFDVMGSSKKPEITIMGLKITNRKEDHTSEAPKPFFESRPNLVSPYCQFPVHTSGFSGNMVGNSVDFPMPPYTYGTPIPIPCMIDSRGTPVVPQILSSVGLNTTTQSAMPPHFLMSSNVAGTSHSGLDVNSVEGGNINFFMQERNGVTEEQGSMNRTESHSGRELYNFMASWQQ